MGRILQLQGIPLDVVYRVPSVPAAGGEAVAHEPAATLAGGGFNAMVAVLEAGGDVVFGGAIGRGPFADIVAEALTDRGIDTPLGRCGERDQGLCIVLIDDQGERTFIAHPGAEGHLDIARLNTLDTEAIDWVMVSGYGLAFAGSGPALSTWTAALPADKQLVFDPSPLVGNIPPDRLAMVLQRADWVSANAREACVLTGQQDPAAAARTLAKQSPAERSPAERSPAERGPAERGPRDGGALVRSGADGCRLACAGMPVLHLPGHAVASVDTNGAGDTHLGSFVALMAAGSPPEAAARYANAAAALSTTRHGPATAPTRRQTLALLQDH